MHFDIFLSNFFELNFVARYVGQPLTYSFCSLSYNLWRINVRLIDLKQVVVRLLECEIFGISKIDVEFDVEVICLGKVSFTIN